MTEEIRSNSNERVKAARELLTASGRREQRLFQIEGVRLVEEALAAGWPLVTVFIAPALLERTERGRVLAERLASGRPATGWDSRQVSLPAARKSPVETSASALSSPSATITAVTSTVLEHLSDTVSPQGVVALARLPEPRAVVPTGFLLVCDGVHDPGNAGTILRAAVASGLVDGVLAIGGADLFAPKVVRAAMGAHFRLALGRATWEEAAQLLDRRRMVLADSEGGRDIWQTDWARFDGLVVGSEAHGPDAAARSITAATCHVPMAPAAESLNVGVAASIILFEAARQRGAVGR